VADADSIEVTISRLLRASVLVAAGVIALGALVLAWRGETGHGLTADVVASFAEDPQPAGPCFVFLRQGDRLLAAIAGVVLLVLALSATGLVMH
jgi:uncharacterized membrane protein